MRRRDRQQSVSGNAYERNCSAKYFAADAGCISWLLTVDPGAILRYIRLRRDDTSLADEQLDEPQNRLSLCGAVNSHCRFAVIVDVIGQIRFETNRERNVMDVAMDYLAAGIDPF